MAKSLRYSNVIDYSIKLILERSRLDNDCTAASKISLFSTKIKDSIFCITDARILVQRTIQFCGPLLSTSQPDSVLFEPSNHVVTRKFSCCNIC